VRSFTRPVYLQGTGPKALNCPSSYFAKIPVNSAFPKTPLILPIRFFAQPPPFSQNPAIECCFLPQTRSTLKKPLFHLFCFYPAISGRSSLSLRRPSARSYRLELSLRSFFLSLYVLEIRYCKNTKSRSELLSPETTNNIKVSSPSATLFFPLGPGTFRSFLFFPPLTPAHQSPYFKRPPPFHH